MLKVVSDVLLESDRGEVTLLCFLDLSAAFDMVDHDILIDKLQTAFGIHGTVLSWISSKGQNTDSYFRWMKVEYI